MASNSVVLNVENPLEMNSTEKAPSAPPETVEANSKNLMSTENLKIRNAAFSAKFLILEDLFLFTVCILFGIRISGRFFLPIDKFLGVYGTMFFNFFYIYTLVSHVLLCTMVAISCHSLNDRTHAHLFSYIKGNSRFKVLLFGSIFGTMALISFGELYDIPQIHHFFRSAFPIDCNGFLLAFMFMFILTGLEIFRMILLGNCLQQMSPNKKMHVGILQM